MTESNDREYSMLIGGTGKQYLRSSMLTLYNFCPWCFKLTLIDGVQREIPERMKNGALFHTIMEMYHNGTFQVEQLSELPDPVQEWATWLINIEEQKKLKPGYLRPIHTELHLKHPDLLLEAHIDRVDWYDIQQEEVEIVEYKTGAKPLSESTQLQAAFYGIVFEATTGAKVAQLVVINPRRKEIDTFPLTASLVKKVARRVAKIRYALEIMNFPKHCTPGKWINCKLCDFEEVCLGEEISKIEVDEEGKEVNDTEKIEVLTELTR